jgi:hypothetical protein
MKNRKVLSRMKKSDLGTRTVLGAIAVGALGAAAAVGLPACSTDSGCVTTRSYFEENVWSTFMSTKCTKCHAPDGVAVSEKGAKFVLQSSSYPGFLDANVANLKEVAKTQYQGVSELLLKPLGKMDHGGGAVIDDGSPEYKALVELVKRFDEGDACSDQPSLTLQGVTMLDGAATLRKASISLAARLPTQEEIDVVNKGGDAGLDAILDKLMQEEAFYSRIKEIWNDVLLTDKFIDNDGRALDFLRKEDYPWAEPFKDQNGPKYGEPRHWANLAIAQEPLNLIDHVVRNNRPFTEILTADYALVNPFSADAYGIKGDIQWKDANDPKEFQEGHVTLGTGIAIPHAGVLSTPSFLNRWQTTPTNRNRGRARRVFKFFLATDVLKIAERPIDATKVTQEENPTRNSQYCNVCHKVIDPVAGMFRGYDDEDYAHYDPKIGWHDEMFSPGFATATMPPDAYGTALAWGAAQLAADSRFAIGAVYTTFQAMTGHEPLTYPNDPNVAGYADLLDAWTAQDQFLRGTADTFVKANYNLRVIVKAVVKSVYYRAVDVPADLNISATSLEGVGTGRLLTPEMLSRKIKAVVGAPWRTDYEADKPHDTMLENYKILYGGIDSDSTIKRLSDPNGVIANIANRMANEVACEVSAFDFTKPKDQRRFFTIDPSVVPESAGNPVEASILQIKTTIVHLHELVLGEKLAIDDPEIERTYRLFVDTWHERQALGTTQLDYRCWGRLDYGTGVAVPDGQQIKDDPYVTIQSWQAVLTYLLSDWKFLHE